MATREFRCLECGRIDTYEPLAKPVHCGKPMRAGELGFVRDKDSVSIDLVKLQVMPDVVWSCAGTPLQVLEVWVFRPGMRNGEKMGWIAEWNTGWEYRVVDGVPNGTGATLTRNAAIESVFNALSR